MGSKRFGLGTYKPNYINAQIGFFLSTEANKNVSYAHFCDNTICAIQYLTTDLKKKSEYSQSAVALTCNIILAEWQETNQD